MKRHKGNDQNELKEKYNIYRFRTLLKEACASAFIAKAIIVSLLLCI